MSPETSHDPVADAIDLQGAACLVTGGAGFIGSHIVRRLLAEGARVRIVDDLSTGRPVNLEGVRDDVELLEDSVVDPTVCATACGGIDFVFHQAAIPSVARSVKDPLATHAACATGTLNMLHAAAAAGVERFVYAGSSSVYGNTPTLPKREDMAPRARSPYAVAKLAGEHYAGIFPDLFGLDTVMFRYFNIFGPRQDPASKYSAAIPLFITQALDGTGPVIDGDGGQTRDFTYVENVVQANLRACFAPASQVSGEVFNVACGERTSVRGLWDEIRELTGSQAEAEHGPPRPGDVRDSHASLGKIRERMGYRVAVPLREGLRRTIEWLRAVQ